MKPATQCCCGCTLLTGVKIIAIFYSIISVSFVLQSLSGEEKHEANDGFKPHVDMADIYAFVYTVVLSFLLWIGISTNDRKFFIIFVIMQLIILAISVVALIVCVVVVDLNNYMLTLGATMFTFLILLPGYIIWIVWSHAERLRTVEIRPTPIGPL